MHGFWVWSQRMAICRTGSQCRECNSTSSLVTMFGALDMKNRVVGSQIRAIGSRHRVIYRAESQHRARGRKWRRTLTTTTTYICSFNIYNIKYNIYIIYVYIFIYILKETI